MKSSRILAALATLFVIASASAQTSEQPVAKANSFAPDMTGIWFNPAESGWGLNIIQQGETMFVTLFVYGINTQPLWLVGSDISFSSSDTSGTTTYSGALFQTTGPYFGASTFNPASVGLTSVGTLSIRFTAASSAQLTYSVNGVTVTKNIVPQTFRTNNLRGLYLGGASPNFASPQCGLPLPGTGPTLLAYDIAPSGNNVTVRIQNEALATCTLDGAVTQYGKLVDIHGSYTCSAGGSGQFAIRRLEAGFDGLSGVYVSLSNAGCINAPVTIGGARVQ